MEQKQEAPEGLQAEAENFLTQPRMSFAMHILFQHVTLPGPTLIASFLV